MNTMNTPTKQEVRQELEKLFSSKEFEGTPVLRSLLEFIVDYSLNGEERSGKDIAVVVFPGSDPDSTNVKANVFSIRDRLNSYFSGVGSKDLVRIELPISRTYRAAFSYKYDAQAVRLYERGLGLLGSDGHAGRLQAERCFDLAIQADENLAEAHLLRLQVVMTDYLLRSVLAVSRHDGPPAIGSRFGDQFTAVKLNSRSWLAWCIYGAGRLLVGPLDVAKQAFEKALELDREKTEENIWYAFYLLFAENRENALRLSRSWDKSTVDESLLVARGLFFYLVGENASAIEALQSFKAAGAEMTTVNLLLQGLVNLASNEEDYIEFGQHWLFLASSYWAHITAGGEDDEDDWPILRADFKDRQRERMTKGRFWTRDPFPDAFAGFNILALVKTDSRYKSALAEAVELLSRLEMSGTCRPFQLAVACMAVGQKEKAVEYLRGAIRDADILAVHAARLPFFKGLDGCQQFEEFKRYLAAGDY